MAKALEDTLNKPANDLQDAILAAWRFAAQAHLGQTLPDGDLPYVIHIGTVAMEVLATHAMEPLANPNLAMQCALLHDTVEDCGTSLEEIEARFGKDVAAGVSALSKRADLPKTGAMTDSLARIRQQPQEVWAVKLADRISNLQPPPSRWTLAKRAQYLEEARTILAVLGEGNPILASRLARKILAYEAYLKPE